MKPVLGEGSVQVSEKLLLGGKMRAKMISQRQELRIFWKCQAWALVQLI